MTGPSICASIARASARVREEASRSPSMGSTYLCDQRVGLTPRLVLFLGVFLQVTVRDHGKCISAWTGGTWTCWIFAMVNLKAETSCCLPCKGKRDGIGLPNCDPSRFTMTVIDELERAVAGRANL